MRQEVDIPVDSIQLPGTLDLPQDARGLVVFAHGSGSSRLSPRNRRVAEALHRYGRFGTLLFDLLTPDEDRQFRNRFDIGLLSARLGSAVAWAVEHPFATHLPIGLFGASTGAAAALRTAADLEDRIGAVVSRGGRPDLAMDELPRVHAATLLIVGGNDPQVIGLNQDALEHLGARDKAIEIVPGATHLFEEPGTLDMVEHLASDWFGKYLVR